MIKLNIPSNFDISAFIALCTLISCSQNKIEKKLITDAKDSIWLLKGNDKDTSMHFGHWQLERDGHAQVYMSINDNIPSAHIIGVEGEIKYTWEFIQKDSILFLGNSRFKIVRFKRDTIFMSTQSNQKFLLIRQYYKPTP